MNEQEHIKQGQADHDLLIEINTKLTILLSNTKDHEVRIRRLEMWGFISVGILYAMEAYFKFLKP